ncbi:cytochrome b/b6 domain-containing protein [Nocardia sp. NPDC051756]|uniref:cytochrome b n=1 Tax=Nocardia sp. NPDC051756 TaxID=3154751 RepID=UPI00342D050D
MRTEIVRFDPLTRVLHWLMAALVIAALIAGAGMVHWWGESNALRTVHMTVGVSVLALAVLRVVNRVLRRGPGAFARLGPIERRVAVGSEILMYALLLAQPLLGWAMVSASGADVRLAGGVELPALVSVDWQLYERLRSLHTYFGYALLVVFTAHICAIAFHALILRDGLLCRMLFGAASRPVE